MVGRAKTGGARGARSSALPLMVGVVIGSILTWLWPLIGAGLPSLEDVIGMIDEPANVEFVAILRNLTAAQLRGVGVVAKAMTPIALAGLYLFFWIPHAPSGLSCCQCSRPAFVADGLISAADPQGCTCASIVRSACWLCVADARRKAAVVRMARYPSAQLYTLLFATFAAILIIDGGELPASVPSVAAGNASMPTIDAGAEWARRAHGSVTRALPSVVEWSHEWFDRVRCSAASLSPTAAADGGRATPGGILGVLAARCPPPTAAARGSCRWWGCAVEAPPLRARWWDEFSRLALRAAALPRSVLDDDAPPPPTANATCSAVESAAACSAAAAAVSARAVATARRAFYVATLSGGPLIAIAVWRSSLRLPSVVLLVLAHSGAAPSITSLDDARTSVGLVTRSVEKWLRLLRDDPRLERFAAWLWERLNRLRRGGAAATFTLFPAFAIGAGAALPAAERSAAADLVALHTSWAERHLAWQAMLGATPPRRAATGALFGLALGVALSLALLFFSVGRAACADRGAGRKAAGATAVDVNRGGAGWMGVFKRFALTSTAALATCTLFGAISGEVGAFDAMMAAAPLVPLASYFVSERASRALGLHVVSMAISLVVLAQCVWRHFGSVFIVLPAIQLAIPFAVALAHHGVNSRAIVDEVNAWDDNWQCFGDMLAWVSRAVDSVFALWGFAVAAYVAHLRTAATLAGRTTPDIFCKRPVAPYTARDVDEEHATWFGAFVSLLILRSFYRTTTRAWSAAQLRSRNETDAALRSTPPARMCETVRAHCRDAVCAMAAEPPIFMLWLAVYFSSGLWSADAAPAVILESIEVALASLSALFEGVIGGSIETDRVFGVLWEAVGESLPKVCMLTVAGRPRRVLPHLVPFPFFVFPELSRSLSLSLSLSLFHAALTPASPRCSSPVSHTSRSFASRRQRRGSRTSRRSKLSKQRCCLRSSSTSPPRGGGRRGAGARESSYCSQRLRCSLRRKRRTARTSTRRRTHRRRAARRTNSASRSGSAPLSWVASAPPRCRRRKKWSNSKKSCESTIEASVRTACGWTNGPQGSSAPRPKRPRRRRRWR